MASLSAHALPFGPVGLGPPAEQKYVKHPQGSTSRALSVGFKRDQSPQERKEPKLNMEDLIKVEDIIEIAKDKWKSRSLQRSLMEHDKAMTDLIYAKALPVFPQLLSDQYGNYLSQKILEHCTDDQFDKLFSLVRDDLNRLANEVHGTRAVQKFVEESVRRQRVDVIVEALKPHVEPLTRSVTGFHVIVKLLEKLPINKSEVILSVLCKNKESIISMGRDQWGCCVLKTCIDKSIGARAELVQEAVIGASLELIQDPYGNYVVQHVLATDHNQTLLPRIVDQLRDHFLDLCGQKFSSNVLEKLLTSANEQHRVRLINGIVHPSNLKPSEVIEKLLFHQYGNYVLQQTLSVAKEPQYSQVVDLVRPFVHDILRVSFGSEPKASYPPKKKDEHTLASEQSQRLAMKLVKRFPALLDGIEDNIRQVITSPQWTYDWHYDYAHPYMQQSPSPYYPSMWDNPYYPWSQGALSHNGTASSSKYMHKPQKLRKKIGVGAGPSGCGGGGVLHSLGSHSAAPGPPVLTPSPSVTEEVRKPASLAVNSAPHHVGRIVGYWPNYTIAYDEQEPAAA